MNSQVIPAEQLESEDRGKVRANRALLADKKASILAKFAGSPRTNLA
jgi:hypothetical protein